MSKHDQQDWTNALARHTSAAEGFANTATSVDSSLWSIPLGEGKWTPAQVTEHLNRTYQVVIDEVRGGEGIRIRSSWLLRQVLRQTILRSILRKRRLPQGARAPSEVAPKEVNGTQTELLQRFGKLSAEFEEEFLKNSANTDKKLTHHIFGEIDLLRGIDFVAIHIEHHHRQISRNPK